MADQWHAIHAGKRLGPITLARLRELLDLGKLDKTDLARANQEGPWITVEQAVAGVPSAAPSRQVKATRGSGPLNGAVAAACLFAGAALLVAAWFLLSGSQPDASVAAVAQPMASTAPAAVTSPIVPNATITAETTDAEPTSLAGSAPPEPPPAADAQANQEWAPGQLPATELSTEEAEKTGLAPGLADLVERCMPSCVKLSIYVKAGDKGTGSGFVVDRQGIVATNYHVIEDAISVLCTFPDGREAKSPGYFLVDPSRDLALIFVDPQTHPLAPLPLSATLPRQGEGIFVIGSPLGLSFRVSQGVMSATGKTAEVQQELGHQMLQDYGPDVVWLQSDAAISHGNSGGPWFNMQGEVVGVCTWGVPVGTNLSFGSAVTELSALLSRVPGEQLKPWSELSRTADDGDANDESGDGVTIPSVVTLPSGRAIPIAEALGVDDVASVERLRKRARARGDEFLELQGQGEQGLGLASFRDFKLDGTSILFADSGQLRLLANYKDGQRHSFQIFFDEGGQPALFVQFEDNRRNGVSCYLRGPSPYVVQEVDRNTVTATHLFVADEVFEEVDLAEASLPQALEAAEHIQRTDSAWQQADAALRRTFEKQSEPLRRLRQQRLRGVGR